MPKEFEDLEFAGSVSAKQADTKGEKIDTTPTNDDEAELQEKALGKMQEADENGVENEEDDIEDDDDNIFDKKIGADTSSADSESSEEDEEEEEEEESKSEDEEGEEEEKIEEVEEKSSEDESSKQEEKKEDGEEAGEESGEKTFLEGEKTSPVSKEVEYKKLREIENNPDLDYHAKEERIVQEFLNIHRDIIPESARTNFQKFIDSGRNTAFLMLDDSLYKLVKEVRNYRTDLPLTDRLSKAFRVVFADKIAKQEQKKGEVKAEIRQQKVGKAIATPTKPASGKAPKSELSSAQREALRRMGVSEEDYQKYGKLQF